MVRWDDSAKLILCQKILEQAPSFTPDYEEVCKNWPGSEPLTVRACRDQWNLLKKGASKTTKSTTSSSTSGSRTPAKPAFQNGARKKTTPASFPIRNKCGNTGAPELNSSSKKRKAFHDVDDSEISQNTQSSPDEGELGNEETDENISDDMAPSTPTARRQPHRSKARSKPFVVDDSSDDVTRRDGITESDSDFDLEKDYESKLSPAAKLQRKRERRQCDMDEDGESTPRAKSDDDTSSQATKRTSWQTAHSRLDDADEV